VSASEAVGRSSRPEALLAALERAGISISVMPTDGAETATPAVGSTLRVAGS